MSRTVRTLLILAGLALIWIALAAPRSLEFGLPDLAGRTGSAEPQMLGLAEGGPEGSQPRAADSRGRSRPIGPPGDLSDSQTPLHGAGAAIEGDARQGAVQLDPGAPHAFEDFTKPGPAASHPTVVAPAFSITSAPADASANSQPPATRLPIIEYHYSTFAFAGVEMRPDWFEQQLQWLAENGFYTLTIEELAAYVEGSFLPPERSVALTFDVGISHFDDYSEVVLPALRRHGLHGIFFVQAHGVREQCDGKLACWDALAAWHAQGVISIGSHTLYHQDFNTLNAAQIAYELRRSKEIIQEKLGITVVGVCYPYDSVNLAAFAILESLGYHFAVGGWTRSDRSAHFQDPQPYSLPRYYPYSNDRMYPAMGGSGGLSFPELMAAAIAPAE